MKVHYYTSDLHFKYPFRIAHGVRVSTPVVFVELRHGDETGYGEAALPPYLSETQLSVIRCIRKVEPLLESFDPADNPVSAIQAINVAIPGNTAAKAAIDIALHDLHCKLIRKPTWNYFGAEKNNAPVTTFTIGIDTEEITRRKLSESDEFPILKIKLNGDRDQDRISYLRSLTAKPIAIDVNQGWPDKEAAIRMIEWLRDKNVLFIEQPLKTNSFEDDVWLKERSPLPVFGDESIQTYSDLDGARERFDGINIKLMKCGGMSQAFKMIQYAKENNIKTMLGCMSESSCGVSAAAQLSPLANFADLDGPLLISDDPFSGIRFREGRIILSDQTGNGVKPIHSA